jgi:hypothetical protein
MDWLSGLFSTLWGYMTRVLSALRHLSFSEIWQWIKKVFDYYRRFRAWWQKNIQGPLDQMRRQIIAIYRQFFKPIIDVIDTVRVGVRILAVFDRQLAAKLDAKLWQLEAWILTPITRAMRTLNGMASIIYAVLTATGRFDATVFIATVVRHNGEIRAALFGLPFSGPTATVPDPLLQAQQVKIDFDNWIMTGGGPIGDGVAVMHDQFESASTVFGV